MQENKDNSKVYGMYQSNELLKEGGKEIVLSENLEEVFSCRKQEGMDDRVAAKV